MDWIVTLLTKVTYTERAFLSNHHSRFFVDAGNNTTASKARSQREGTQEPVATKLVLKFSTKPRMGGGEFVVGSGEAADIRLGSQKEGVSARHLLIGFDANRNVTVKDVSSFGSVIRYVGPGNDEKRTVGDKHKPSCWVIPQGWPVLIRIESYSFSLVRPDVSRFKQYRENVDAFMQAARSDGLNFFSNLALASGPHTGAVATPQGGVRKAYIQGQLLGEGGAGRVYKMYDSSTWEPMAGKLFNNTTNLDKEVEIISKLNHPGVAKYISPITRMPGSERMLVMMEYFHLGSLDAVNRARRLDLFETIQVAVQISTTLEYLHSPQVKVVHRDIKPENILVRSRNIHPQTGLPLIRVVLSDFGCGKWGQTEMGTHIGTPGWAAPELCVGNNYTSRVDIWSLGAVLLDLLGLSPEVIGDDFDMETVDYAKKAKGAIENAYQDHSFTDATFYLYELMRRMLKLNPDRRPAANECRESAQQIYRRFVNEHQQPQTNAQPQQAPPSGPPKRQGTNMSQTGAAPPRKRGPAPVGASSSKVQGQQPPRTAAPIPTTPKGRTDPKKDPQIARK